MIPKFEVLMPRHGLRLKPWTNWGRPNNPPAWWTAYNKTKHHRHTDYHKACLKNVLNAVSGLFVICLYLNKDRAEAGELTPSVWCYDRTRKDSEEFIMEGWSLQSCID